MAMVSVALVAAYRRIWGSDRLVWFKGRKPPGARAALTKWTEWTLAVAVHCYDDSTINIVAAGHNMKTSASTLTENSQKNGLPNMDMPSTNNV